MKVSKAQELAGVETAFTGVAHLLRDQLLEVPPYQRSFSWEAEQIDAFWSDLLAALISDQPVYFLGTVVLTSGSGRTTVIDGQQRLATVSMLLAAIRNQFADREESASAEFIDSRYLSSISLKTQALEPRLHLNTTDHEFYERVVLKGQQSLPSDLVATSTRLLDSSFERLSENLSGDILRAGPYWRDRLLSWVDLLDSRVRIIVVTVKDDADAFLIFETLNDRGLSLTVADVVKNYLFGLCRNDIEAAEQAGLTLYLNSRNQDALS